MKKVDCYRLIVEGMAIHAYRHPKKPVLFVEIYQEGREELEDRLAYATADLSTALEPGTERKPCTT